MPRPTRQVTARHPCCRGRRRGIPCGHDPTPRPPRPDAVRHDDLRDHVGTRGPARRDQPGAGLPRHRRPTRGPRGGGGGHPGRAQPVPTRRRGARAARRGRRPPGAVLPPAGRSPARGARDGRRHGGDRGDGADARPAGRRGRDLRAVLRLVRGHDRAGRRVRRTSVLRFPDFAVDEASLRAAFSPRTRLVLLNTPHNPTGKVFTRDELELVCALAREHDAWVVTDEVYEHLTFDGARARARGHPARDGGADAHHLLGRQDLLDDRMEGRLGQRPGRRGRGGAVGQAVPHVRRVRPVPARGGGWAWPCPTTSTRAWQARCSTSATGSSTGCGRPAWRCRCPGAPTSSSRTPHRSGPPTRCRSATSCPARAGVVGVPVSVFHDDVEAARTLVRFAFCKQDDVLDEACRRLAALRG